MTSNVTAASAGVSMYDHLETIANMLRSSDPLSDSDLFRSLSSEAKALLYVANDRAVKFICMINASPETQAARRQIEAFDPNFLGNAPFPEFLSRLVSQKSVVSGPDLAGESAPRAAAPWLVPCAGP
jgi:hypothetical protein